MPRGRKPRTIEENFVIQKCKPMFYELWKEKDNISMTELKILDIYMAAINSHDVNTRNVLIDAEHLRSLLGANYSKSDLVSLFLKMTGLSIRVSDKVIISLFEKAEILENENEDLQVLLQCSQTAQQYFFNLDNIGYFSYKLKNTLAINSVYSYLLFNYLEMNRFRETWEVSVDELKQILHCEDECYTKFKVFNDAILKKCYKELNENTSCRYSYETVKQGRYVKEIKFTVEPLEIIKPIAPLAEPIPDLQQITFFDSVKSEYTDFFIEHFGDSIFEDVYRESISDQMQLLKINSDESQTDIILKRCIQRFKLVINMTKISDNDKYFRKIIETECVNAAKMILKIKQQQEQKPKKEQSYDLEEFEKFAVTYSKNTKSPIPAPNAEEPKQDLVSEKNAVTENEQNSEKNETAIKKTIPEQQDDISEDLKKFKEECENLIKNNKQ